MDDQTLKYVLQLKDEFSSKLNAIEGHVKGLDKSVQGVHASASHAAEGGIGEMVSGFMELAVVAEGANLAFEFIQSSVEAFNESQQAAAQLNATLASTKNIAGLNIEALNKQAESVMKASLFDDDDITKAQSVLATFTSIRGSVYMDAIPAISDLATKMGGDLQGATIQVGKALNDPIQGMNALRRVGVSFSDDQKVVIKRLQETGHLAEAQAIVLKELQTEFGGSAAASANTLQGQMVIMQHQFQNIKEVIGGATSEIELFALKAVGAFLNKNYGINFETLGKTVEERLPKIVEFVQGVIEKTMSFLQPIINVVVQHFNTVYQAANRIFSAIGSLLGGANNQFLSMGRLVSYLVERLFTASDAVLTVVSYIVSMYSWVVRVALKFWEWTGVLGVVRKAWDGITNAMQWTFENVIQPIVGAFGKIGKWIEDATGVKFNTSAGNAEGKEKSKNPLDNLLGVGNSATEANAATAGASQAASATKNASTGTKATTINIKIENLGKEINIHTTNLKEGAGEVQRILSNMLMGAVNDSQIIASN